MEVKKSKKAAIENRRGTWLLMGFVATLAFMFVTFEWTQHDVNVASGSLTRDPIFEENLIPITFREEKLQPPPPPLAEVSEVLTLVKNDEKVADVTVKSSEDIGERVEIGRIAPKEVEREEPAEEPIFVVAEKMPSFPGGDAALLQYLGKNIKYPTISQEIGSQGRVIVQFVVDKDGTITNPVVVRSVDAYLDKEALRVINAMPKWTPGKQRNQPVRVKYTLPVMFRLQ